MAAPLPITPVPPCGTDPAHTTEWICEACGAGWCNACVKRVGPPRRSVEICADCQGRCVAVESWIARQAGAPARAAAAGAPLAGAAEAWVFPVRGYGWVVLLTGGFLLGLVRAGVAVLGALTFGFGYLILAVAQLALLGYIARFWMETIRTSAHDLDAPLDWPEPEAVGGLSSLVWTALIVYLPPLLLLLPAILVGQFAPPAWGGDAAAVLSCVGLFFLPMAYIAMALYDSVAALNPLFLAVSIGRVLGPYIGLVLYSGAVGAVIYGCHRAAGALRGWGIAEAVLGTIAGAVLSLYLLSVMARVLGRFYHDQASRLDW